MNRFNPEILDSAPPHSPQSEQAVIGSILMRPEIFEQVIGIVQPDDFYTGHHRQFYERLVRMRADNAVIQPGALLEQFTPQEVERFGGRSELVASIAATREAVGSPLEAPRHAKTVAEGARLRGVITTCLDRVKEAYSGTVDSAELCTATIENIEKLAAGSEEYRLARPQVTTVEDAEKKLLDGLQRGGSQLLSTGVPVLDEALGGGVEPGEMVVIGGLPSHGKSVNGLQAARGMVEVGRNVAFVSHEMTAAQIAKRMISTRTTIDADSWDRHTDALGRESIEFWKAAGKVFLVQQCSDIANIERAVARLASQHALSLIVVDHAQLTRGEGKTRYEQQTDASGRYKALALRHDAVCLVLSQLNREAAKGEAESHHLKETGSLEQDADVVVLCKWPWKADQREDPHKYIFKITKNRNRAIRSWEVAAIFRPSRQTIESPRPERHSEFDDWR